jgi:predicted Zn-dependent peptidase
MRAAGIVVAAWLLAAAAAVPQPPPAGSVAELEFPPLAEFEIPEPRREVLSNGMVVLLLEDRELPLVEAVAFIRTGSRLEPADHAGLADLTGEVLRTGGTTALAADELDLWLESRAASIETGIGTSAGSASLSCLTKDFPEVLAVFADVLRRPAFAPERLEVAKTQAAAGIARQNDNPQSILFREHSELVYGEESPYARVPTYATLARIGREDLVAWHGRYLHPEGVVLGLVGDFDSGEALALVRRVFGDWERAAEPPPAGAPPYREEPRPGVFFAEKEKVNQASIAMGHLGLEKDHPDLWAVEVLNEVLAGGDDSRLFSRIRSDQGLAYVVTGGVGSNWDYPGVARLWMTTKTETTAEGIEALLGEARRLVAEPPSVEEVAAAKEAILNSFVFNYDSRSKVLRQQLLLEVHGYPLDWLERYRQGIEGVSVEAVAEAAGAHLRPASFAILVVGTPAAAAELAGVGEVTHLDISIPPPRAAAEPDEPGERGATNAAPEGPAAAASETAVASEAVAAGEAAVATEAARARGDELVARAVAAIGGAEALDRVESIEVEAKAVTRTPQGEMEIPVHFLAVYPDRYRQQVALPVGNVVTVVSPQGGFVETRAGVEELPEEERLRMLRAMRRDPLPLLKSRGLPGFQPAAQGPREVEGRQVEEVRVEMDGEPVIAGIDAETGRIVSLRFQGLGPRGEAGEVMTTYDSFREVEGLLLPFASVQRFEGEPMGSVFVEVIRLNPEVGEEAFAPPDGP